MGPWRFGPHRHFSKGLAASKLLESFQEPPWILTSSSALGRCSPVRHVNSRLGSDPGAGESPPLHRLPPLSAMTVVLTVAFREQPVASSTRTITLQPAWEWRFEVSSASSVVVKLVGGTAEKDGVELALRNAYAFSGVKSKILTWHGCTLEIEGRCDDDFVAEYSNPVANPATSYLNLHVKLAELRAAAARDRREGPRVLIAGPPNTGKTTLARTITSYATRQNQQPLVVNADPKEGMLSLPGTLSAAVFATVIDPESVGGWGSTPTSGPSGVPVKLPLVYNFGRASAEDDPDFYRALVARLAGTASGRLSEDESVRASGVVVDTMGISEKSKIGLDLLAHIVDELSSTASCSYRVITC